MRMLLLFASLVAPLALPTSVGAKARSRLALLPVGGVNVPASTGQRLSMLLQRELRRRRLEVLSVGVMPPPECDDPCIAAIGGRAGAGRLLRLEVGGLGGTYVLRLTLYDVAKGARQGSWQEVLKALEEKQVQPALARMINGFAPPPPMVKGKAWYKRWWVWAAAAGVAAAGTAIAITLTSSDGPDGTIVPPSP